MNTENSQVGPPEPPPARRSNLVGYVEAPSLHVMSWNVRRRIPHLIPRPADRWDRRAPALKALLSAERPTLLGVQEALADQAQFIGDSLGANYAWVGRGRNADGRGEGCPIYFDTQRLDLIDWIQTALSDRPTRPGSVSWGNVIPRILVSAAFVDRASARRFMVLNTHLDHLSGHSRLRSVQAIRRIIADSELPAVLTGDMNAPAGSSVLCDLFQDDLVVETWVNAHSRETEEWGTFANYKAPRSGGKRIDWIFASPVFRVERVAINTQQYRGAWASDHLPVQTVLALPEHNNSP
ncbi:endonuclease/exonuclease/phosphatase family protein [Arthrobacter sp. TMP15]|uniref:endonuclease/exonuclease/phosphatase family protein n=1 Tax=Arthrobacter sp. TMP15 TaxID=3140789 RepID=UPI0031BA34A2